MAPALGGTEVHDLRSATIGDDFRIFVGHCGPDPEAALLVTDANGLFGLTVDTVRMMQIPALIPSLLVIGIGYPEADAVIDTAEIRARDLTPTPSKHFPGSGHADDFTGFISNELGPWLADRFPNAAEHLTYFGHSLGGLFGAYALLTRPAVFDRYILSSPSLWWDNEMIFDLQAKATIRSLEAEVFLGIGALETDTGRRLESANLPDRHPAKPPPTHLDMVADMRRFVAELTQRHGDSLDIGSVEVDGEFHATVAGIVLNRALRHFYS